MLLFSCQKYTSENCLYEAVFSRAILFSIRFENRALGELGSSHFVWRRCVVHFFVSVVHRVHEGENLSDGLV